MSKALRTQSRIENDATTGVSINEVLEESMMLTAGRIKLFKTNKQLNELPEITCFRSKIGQVLTNLLANAGDALTEKRQRIKEAGGERFVGKITVETSAKEYKDSKGVLIAISDNGDGVPESIQQKIFDQFFTTKAAGVGTGLGLSLSTEIVKSHQGTLSVTQDSELGGARFELWLPIEPEQLDMGQDAA